MSQHEEWKGMAGLEFQQATGKRTAFAEDPLVDALWVAVVALTAELSVTRTRLDTVERLLEAQGTLLREKVESYEPDDAVARHRAQVEQEVLARVFRRFAQGFS